MVSAVIGVDTHKATHSAAVVQAGSGGVVAQETVPVGPEGYTELIDFADTHSQANDRAWAIEGTGSYGAGLTSFLTARGEWVIEIDRPSRPARRDGAKSDDLDAVRAAREALGRERWAQPRARGPREALRVLVTTRDGAVRDQTRAINRLKALVVTAPDLIRDRLANHLSVTTLAGACTRLRHHANHDTETTATIDAMRRVAQRITHLENEVAAHHRDITRLCRQLCPQLLTEPGVGPISAANAYLAWSHPGRCRNEAAYANLGGVAPIPASSGERTRYRLNRGGDRRLNRALHTIVLTRARYDPATQAYIARRVAEGKTTREARRCLKRYTARRLYRLLEHHQATTPTPPLDT